MPAIADRVKESSTTTGTGSILLAGAQTGFQSFQTAFTTGSTVYYCITDQINWEVGVGTFTTGPNTLARTTVLSSSNSGALVNFSAASLDVYSTIPASAAAVCDTSGVIAPVGMVGEFLSNFVAEGSAIAGGATGVPANVTSLSLTAGDWDVTGYIVYFANPALVMTASAASISSTSATVDVASLTSMPLNTTIATNEVLRLVPPTRRVSISAPTTYYLVANMVYSSGGLTIAGRIQARRMR